MLKMSDKKLFGDCTMFYITNAVIIICLLSLLVLKYVFVWGYVPTESMYPTIEKGDKIGVFKLASNIKYGDIIVFNTPKELSENTDAKYLCKRVVATGGDIVEIINGKLTINGVEVDESMYVKNNSSDFNMDKISVPAGYVFVMGDNRDNSYDSRYWDNKFVGTDTIVGVVRLKANKFKICLLNNDLQNNS